MIAITIRIFFIFFLIYASNTTGSHANLIIHKYIFSEHIYIINKILKVYLIKLC